MARRKAQPKARRGGRATARGGNDSSAAARNDRTAWLNENQQRLQVLRANFAGVAKALRPALDELAARTERKLEAEHFEEDRQCKRLAARLERNLEEKLHKLKYMTELKMQASQRVHAEMMESISEDYKRTTARIRTDNLTHAKLSLMTHIDESAHPARPPPLTLSEMHLHQGSNSRVARRPAPATTTIPRESNARGDSAPDEDFYASTRVMWDDWVGRMDEAVGEGRAVGGVLPRRWVEVVAGGVAAAAGRGRGGGKEEGGKGGEEENAGEE